MTTLLITADTGAARPGLADFLDARSGLRVVVGVAGLSLAQQIADVGPDVLLADLGATRATSLLRDIGAVPVPPALVLLARDWRGLDAESLRVGVRGVLPREATAAQIGAAIEAVAHGLVVLQPDVARGLRPATVRAPRAAAFAEPLTARELEVLAAMADGLGNKAIATRLAISPHTAKFHVASILSKLNATSRAEAVAIGLRQGLLMI